MQARVNGIVQQDISSGCSAARLAHTLGVGEVASSNPAIPTILLFINLKCRLVHPAILREGREFESGHPDNIIIYQPSLPG